MNNEVQLNPYRQNAEMIKAFFRKPLVLVAAILSFVNIGVTFILGLVGIADDFSGMIYQFADEFGNEPISSGDSRFICIDLFGILLAISFLLLFICARKADSNMNVAATFFKVISVIQLVVFCLLCVLMLVMIGLFLMIMFMPFGFMALILIPIFIFMIAWLLILGISQAVFANSVKKSVNSIYLYKNGAKLYGIMNIISAVLFLALIASEFINTPAIFSSTGSFDMESIKTFLPLAISLVLSVATVLTTGIVAIQYSGYIKALTQQFVTEAPNAPVYPNNNFQEPEPFQGINGATPIEPFNPPMQQLVCQNCGNPVNEDDYFCNNCGSPIKK